MNSLRKYFGGFLDDFDSSIDLDWFYPKNTYRIVDPEKYEIVPKLSYYETLIKKKQEEIELLDRQKDSYEKKYLEIRKTLTEEKENLIKDRDSKKQG